MTSNMWKHSLIALSGVLMGVAGLWQTIPAASAATTTVKAVRPVYLRSTPRIAHNSEARELTGSRFQVIAGGTSGWWHVRDSRGRTGYVIHNRYWIVPTTTGYSTTTALPPGVKLDTSIRPWAPRYDTWTQKFDAVLAVAKSKLGTPYRWGHNEDRGQYGFDCSNFTAYVYHHALGYKMSGASLVQASSVGWRVSRSRLRPGDLLIFENGKHVGIYIGHNEMIEEGGGLGKVGYLSVGPSSYWGKHITAVKQMF